MKAEVALFLACLVVASGSYADDAAPRYRYRGWFDDQALVIAMPAPGSEYGSLEISNATYQAEFCDRTSKYFCFKSHAFAFAVPKRIEPGVRRWTESGLTFEVVRDKVEISLLGTRITGLLFIKLAAGAKYGGEPTDRDTFYLYSSARGLVGFGFDPARQYSTMLWMEGSHGFGASVVER